MTITNIPEQDAKDIIARYRDERIATHIYHGQKIWMKNYGFQKRTFAHTLQQVLSRLIPYPVLRPTATYGGKQSLEFETAKANDFKQHGILCPIPLYTDETYALFADAGTSLDHAIKDNNAQECTTLINGAATALGRLHSNGLYHGRPYLRDMTVQGDTIGFLDFEEDALAVMSLEDAQARDIWIFSLNLTKYYRDDVDTHKKYLISYFQACGTNHLARVEKLVNVISPITRFLDTIGAQKWGKDILYAIQGTKALNEAFKDQR